MTFEEWYNHYQNIVSGPDMVKNKEAARKIYDDAQPEPEADENAYIETGIKQPEAYKYDGPLPRPRFDSQIQQEDEE